MGLFNCSVELYRDISNEFSNEYLQAGYGKKIIEKLTPSKRKKAKTSQASLLPDTSCLLAFHQNDHERFSERRKERNAYRQVGGLKDD